MLITPRSESALCADTISYGVQDLVYTRVFAMIVVRPRPEPRTKEAAKETADQNPFQCLAFVCDSRQTARRLTFALAAAFKVSALFSFSFFPRIPHGHILIVGVFYFRYFLSH